MVTRMSLYDKVKENDELSESDAVELFKKKFKDDIDYCGATVIKSTIEVEDDDDAATQADDDSTPAATEEETTDVFVVGFILQPDKDIRRLIACFDDSYTKKQDFLDLLREKLGVADFLYSTVGVGLHNNYKITMKIDVDKVDAWK